MIVKDKIIVVTGAGSGIGRALVAKFVAEGARQVIAVDINAANARQTADENSCVVLTPPPMASANTLPSALASGSP
jgi:NAD(P)-dependent dehydrogenase (short-subunit alcohol dehydrogenase family)